MAMDQHVACAEDAMREHQDRMRYVRKISRQYEIAAVKPWCDVPLSIRVGCRSVNSLQFTHTSGVGSNHNCSAAWQFCSKVIHTTRKPLSCNCKVFHKANVMLRSSLFCSLCSQSSAVYFQHRLLESSVGFYVSIQKTCQDRDDVSAVLVSHHHNIQPAELKFPCMLGRCWCLILKYTLGLMSRILYNRHIAILWIQSGIIHTYGYSVR